MQFTANRGKVKHFSFSGLCAKKSETFTKLNNMKKGKFIVIDGADGCGKQIQTKITKIRLDTLGYKTETIDFPRYADNFFGKIIRNCIDGQYGEFARVDPYLASIPYAGDRFESKPQIEAWLNAGINVVSDRYVSANQLHQGGKIKDPIARQKYFEWLEYLEYGTFEIPRPDLIIYLDVPHSVSVKHMNKGATDRAVADAVENDVQYQLNARQSALAMLQDPTWVKIQCGTDDGEDFLPIQEINDMIFANILTVL